jgi:3-methylfumaryl-CoA hydratase
MNALLACREHALSDRNAFPMSDSENPTVRMEVCSVAAVRRVAAMLDLPADPVIDAGSLPRGWHFFMLGADTQRSELRADGFPGLGVAMPELGLPRLLLGGRAVSYRGDIPIGANVTRTSAVQRIERKNSASGPMAVATITHMLRVEQASEPSVVETQTYLLFPSSSAPTAERPSPPHLVSNTERTKTVVPDETLLFQYSALGFNSHRIHIDRSFARQVEGYPDLVVNGGLSTLLLTEFARTQMQWTPASVRIRHLKPLFCRYPSTLVACLDGSRGVLKALNEKNAVAVDMEIDLA